MTNFILNGKNLSLEHLEEIVFQKQKVFLGTKAKKRMVQSHNFLQKELKEGKTIYGLNTGFGIFSDIKIPTHQIPRLQENLIRSHACGVGPLFNEEEVRAILLLKAQGLSLGHSSIRPLIVEKLLLLLNKNIIPPIPQKGSVGASGDLAPLAHLALAIIRKIKLEGREGLALINGTQVMAALSALNIIRAKKLLTLFDIAASLSLEGLQGSRRPFYAPLHALRPHFGQKLISKNIWKLTEKSQIQRSHENCGRVQDPYSFRCIPQVHGSSREAFLFAKKVIEVELNSVTDNPIFLFNQNHEPSGQWISGGHFHGQCLSQAMDILAIAITTMTNISEKRIEKLLDPKFSGLPAFLTKKGGLESGLMLAHVTSASLTSQNKVLSHPASTDTISTSGHKEDHVSMGVHAALKAKEILINAEDILAIEFLAASEAIEQRRPLKTSPPLEKVMSLIRTKVSPIKCDRIFSKDIKNLKTTYPKILYALKDIAL